MSQNLAGLHSECPELRHKQQQQQGPQAQRGEQATRARQGEKGASPGKAGPRERRVWALCPAGVVDWRKSRSHRLSRVLDEEACALSIARPPCAPYLSEPAANLKEPAWGADSTARAQRSGGKGIEDSGVQELKWSGGRYVWTMPGCAINDVGTDGLRILVSSTTSKRTCVPMSEMCFAFQDCARHLSLEDFLRRYCFEPTWTCPLPSCSADQLEHQWCFLHEYGKVRVRVSRSAPDTTAVGVLPGLPDITLRTRCLSCARTTNPGSLLSKLGGSVSFGRFLLTILSERHLVSEDPSCCHGLHGQLLMFSMQLRSHALTALFMYEPITLTQIDIPSSHLNPLSPATEEQLIAHEIAEALAATEVLLTTAAAVTKNNPDHMWLSSGHVSKVFQVRNQLQELSHSVRTSSIDLSSSSDACDTEVFSAPASKAPCRDYGNADENTTGEVATDLQPASKLEVEQDAKGEEGGIASDSFAELKDIAMDSKGPRERLALALKYKTKILLLAQALFEDAPSEGAVGGKSFAVRGMKDRIFSFQGASISMSSSSYEREEESKDSENLSTPGVGSSGSVHFKSPSPQCHNNVLLMLPSKLFHLLQCPNAQVHIWCECARVCARAFVSEYVCCVRINDCSCAACMRR